MRRLTRRRFLAGSAAITAAPAVAAPLPSVHAETIVVGAGAAGIAAARRLRAAGREVMIVEASDRVGGRCVTDSTTFGLPFDLGANWIYSPDVNPVAKLVVRTGLDVYRAPPGQRLRIGRRNGREGELEDFLDALVRSNRAIAEAARKSKADVDCAHALPPTLGDWRPTVEFVLGAYGCGKGLNEISAVDFAKLTPRDTAAFCRQGFGTLLGRLVRDVPIRLSTPVQRIETLGRGRVELETPRGTIHSHYVIVTVSTDALARIGFAPAPARQLEAAQKLKLGRVERIGIQFNGNALGLQRDDLVFEKADNDRTAALLANVGGTALSHVNIGGALARDLSQQGERAMTDFAAEWLIGLFGADIRKAIARAAATRWGAEPYVLGSIASAAPGGQEARRILMETVRDRLFFAGEAVHETQWGTVNGAWESGERAAEGVLRLMGLIRDPQQPQRESKRPQRRQR